MLHARRTEVDYQRFLELQPTFPEVLADALPPELSHLTAEEFYDIGTPAFSQTAEYESAEGPQDRSEKLFRFLFSIVKSQGAGGGP